MTAPTLEVLEGWGLANFARSWVYRPRTEEEVGEALRDAERRGLSVVHRGAGQSYGDAALNEGGAVVEMSGLNRIPEFDAERGLVRAEAGVTIRQLWECVLPSGWWPPVVPGTMAPTLGGCVAMNVHGKNGVQAGPIGEHVEGLTLLRPSGEVVRLEAVSLQSVIGAQGLNGTILDVTLRLKRVRSGYLGVSPVVVRSLDEALESLDAAVADSDYTVGWLDAFARGRALGRGLLHAARYLPSDHVLAGKGLAVAAQRLPARVAGVFPKRHAWRLLRLFTHDAGMRAIGTGRYVSGRIAGSRPYLQSHAAFHFLLDYVPNWNYAYRPHGLVQYQLFVPKTVAPHALGEALRLQHRRGVVSYLAVLKAHRAEAGAASYAVNGYSLALDFPVRPRRLADLMALVRDFDALRAEVGGRIYAAKDAVSVGRLPPTRDPQFSSNLVRRWERGR